MRFSQRIGKTSVRERLQTESIDARLENRLWNVIIDKFFGGVGNVTEHGQSESTKEQVCRIIWTEFLELRSDEIPVFEGFAGSELSISEIIDHIKQWYLHADWYEKYDLIEFLAQLSENEALSYLGFTEDCNRALKKEMAGYRIIEQRIVQLTSEEEITEIEEALSSSKVMWKPVHTHLKTALENLANRENPGFRNSIKESISAVEAFCIIITGDDKATLGKALSEIEKNYKIHGALKNAFSSLYGYTSDSSGIRHALLQDDIPVTMEDAKFMLVSCSAFINYLKVKIAE